MFEYLILSANVPSLVASVLLKFLLVHQFFSFAYFDCEKGLGLPSIVLSNQFLEGGSEVEKSQALHGFPCGTFDLILGL